MILSQHRQDGTRAWFRGQPPECDGADGLARDDQQHTDCDDRIYSSGNHGRAVVLCSESIADTHGVADRADCFARYEYNAASNYGIRRGGRYRGYGCDFQRWRDADGLRWRQFICVPGCIPKCLYECCHQSDEQQRLVGDYKFQ